MGLGYGVCVGSSPLRSGAFVAFLWRSRCRPVASSRCTAREVWARLGYARVWGFWAGDRWGTGRAAVCLLLGAPVGLPRLLGGFGFGFWERVYALFVLFALFLWSVIM